MFLLRDGCFVDPSIIRIQDDRHFFFWSLEICLLVFVSFLFLISCRDPWDPAHLFFFFSLFLFRGIRVGTPTNLEGGSGRSGLDLLLF